MDKSYPQRRTLTTPRQQQECKGIRRISENGPTHAIQVKGGEAKQSVVAGPPGCGLGVEPKIAPGKIDCYENSWP